jgi:hypothetical protein
MKRRCGTSHWSIPLQRKQIAIRRGVSVKMLGKILGAGAYKIRKLTRQTYQLETTGFAPTLLVAFNTPDPAPPLPEVKLRSKSVQRVSNSPAGEHGPPSPP